MSVAQIYVKALDKEDRLVPVAFLDVPPYIATLRTFKNFLLIGDMVKSVWLAVFQVSGLVTTACPDEDTHHTVQHRNRHSSWML
jgi:hypothetical protein